MIFVVDVDVFKKLTLDSNNCMKNHRKSDSMENKSCKVCLNPLLIDVLMYPHDFSPCSELQ